MDAKGDAVSGCWVAAVSAYYKVAGAESDAPGRALLRVPVDAPLQYVVAGKAGVGLDYFVFRGERDPPSDPHKRPLDYSEPFHFVLNGTRTVTLRVLDERQQPMAGADVNAWFSEKPKKGGDLNTGLEEFGTVTDSQGVATLSIVPADGYEAVPAKTIAE